MQETLKICFFDIDGTLIRTGGAGMRAMRQAAEHLFGVAVPEGGLEFDGRTDRAIGGDLLQACGVAGTEQNLQRLQEAYLARLGEQLQLSAGEVLPGVREVLNFLEQRTDVILAILTGNSEGGAALKLAHFALEECFEFGAYGEWHDDRRDVARAAQSTAVARAGSAAGQMRYLVIGDTPHDVECGKSIGARVIAVATGRYDVGALQQTRADLVLRDFRSELDWDLLLDS